MWHAAMLCCQEDIGATRRQCRSGFNQRANGRGWWLVRLHDNLESMMHCIALNQPDRYFQSPACVSELSPCMALEVVESKESYPSWVPSSWAQASASSSRPDPSTGCWPPKGKVDVHYLMHCIALLLTRGELVNLVCFPSFCELELSVFLSALSSIPRFDLPYLVFSRLPTPSP
jgi:hypothetical protein